MRRDATDVAALDAGGFHDRRHDIHREFRRRQRAVHRDFREQQRELRRMRRRGV